MTTKIHEADWGLEAVRKPGQDQVGNGFQLTLEALKKSNPKARKN